MKIFLSLLLLSPFAAGQTTHWVEDSRLAGGEIALKGVHTIVFWSPFALVEGGSDEVYQAEWTHRQLDGVARPVQVRYERPNGMDPEVASGHFYELVAIAIGFYPPNVPPAEGIEVGGIFFSGGQLPQEDFSIPGEEVTGLPVTDGTDGNPTTLSVNWTHDPDGDGPLQPITVGASVEIRPGEGSPSAARRLGRAAQALLAVFPPNVPTPAPSGG